MRLKLPRRTAVAISRTLMADTIMALADNDLAIALRAFAESDEGSLSNSYMFGVFDSARNYRRSHVRFLVLITS